jgi:hypothetical protein
MAGGSLLNKVYEKAMEMLFSWKAERNWITHNSCSFFMSVFRENQEIA